MTFNHIGKHRMLDNQLYIRRPGSFLHRAERHIVTVGVLVLLLGFAVVAFIWANPAL